MLNDLWKYSESDDWVWIAGSDQVNEESNYDGPGETYPGGRSGSAMWIGNNDKVWIFGGRIESGLKVLSLNNLRRLCE